MKEKDTCFSRCANGRTRRHLRRLLASKLRFSEAIHDEVLAARAREAERTYTESDLLKLFWRQSSNIAWLVERGYSLNGAIQENARATLETVKSGRFWEAHHGNLRP